MGSSQESLGANRTMGRRSFARAGSIVLAAAAGSRYLSAASEGPAAVRVGLMTDLHYADKKPAGSRHYRDTLAKLEEASERLRDDKPDFVVELGDLIDAASDVQVERRYLKTINERFAAIHEDRHYVLGNHCVDTLTKEEFLGGVGQAKSYYSFDRGGIHFIVLDSCFRGDGVAYGRKNFKWTDANVPEAESDWLKADLARTESPVVVFAHQRLDDKGKHSVRNAAAVRKLLESSGKVLAVFQGHSHKNDLKEIAGIHYCTLRAMVEGPGEENSGYSLMEIASDGTIRLKGFRKQSSRMIPS